MKTSEKLKFVFEKFRPHINGHITTINEFWLIIEEVEEMERNKEASICVHEYQIPIEECFPRYCVKCNETEKPNLP
jgi:hypothetical protein